MMVAERTHRRVRKQNESIGLVGSVVESVYNDRNRVVHMPEVALRFISEFERYFILAFELRLHIYDAAFAFFLREAIHEKNGLSALHAWC
jgi:hypothetical protein